MDFVAGSGSGSGSDGASRDHELLNGSSSSFQVGGNCSISPQIYDRATAAVDFETGREEEKEHMFDKVVTPSDVGKLNRLVIPKQHAERYFPLDSTNNDKGLLLNFEDRSGKSWRFRYSYWNSSQSYVMTKGWSRFVKDKKLDAGDIVSFHRSSSSLDRLFIDWRRRPFHHPNSAASHNHHHFSWSPLLMRPPPPPPPVTLPYYSQQQQQQQQLSHHHNNYNHHHHHHHNYLMSNYHPYRYGYGSVVPGSERPKYPYSSSNINAMSARRENEESPVLIRNLQPPAAAAGGGKKQMRLFGVNMECASGDADPAQQHHHLQLSLYDNGNDNNNNKGKAISNSNSNSLDLDLELDM